MKVNLRVVLQQLEGQSEQLCGVRQWQRKRRRDGIDQDVLDVDGWLGSGFPGVWLAERRP